MPEVISQKIIFNHVIKKKGSEMLFKLLSDLLDKHPFLGKAKHSKETLR